MGSRIFTAEQVEFIRQGYRELSLAALTEALNARFGLAVTERQVRAFTRNHVIRSSRTGRFEQGNTPWNKGSHFTAGGRSVETRFKPGHQPQTWVPIGTEVTGPDGYRKRKIRDDARPGMSRRNWKFVHVLVWEEHHGPVPDGHAVTFRDGDRQNCAIENLQLLSRQELLYLNRNGLSEIPAELRDSATALAKLETTRHRKRRSLT